MGSNVNPLPLPTFCGVPGCITCKANYQIGNQPMKFKGNNTLELNEATMIIAMQMYFDATFKEGLAPQVQSVQQSSNKGYVFLIQVSDGAQQ